LPLAAESVAGATVPVVSGVFEVNSYPGVSVTAAAVSAVAVGVSPSSSSPAHPASTTIEKIAIVTSVRHFQIAMARRICPRPTP